VPQMTYELQVRQQMTLTPRLQQSVKLLQMSTLDFSREVVEAIANNPFLEEQEDASGSATPDALAGKAAPAGVLDAHAPEGLDHADEASAMKLRSDGADGADAAVTADAPAPQYLESGAPDGGTGYSGDYPTSRGAGPADTDVGQWARETTTLQDALESNLCSYQLSERDRCLVQFIIEAIDDDGYLRVPPTELAGPEQFSPPPSAEEWEVALRLVQQAGKPGIAARSLSECLALQLKALPADTPGVDLALAIAQDHLDRLGRSDYAGLARLLGVKPEEAQEAGLLIRKLDPRPGASYTAIDPSCYVVPDVVVRKVGKLWVAFTNTDAVPQARLNNLYAQLFRETRYSDRGPMAQALQEARWLMRSLEQRSSTIQRVAQAIVARQQTFFDYGEIALRPMMLSEIAEELGMHESTVSRATSNKYLASPRGVYEFKHFFSRELATRSGGTCSAVAVRALIQEMIEAEDPREPLSDVMLASKLEREGVIVARRTVSKYRAQIKYPPAELRRAP